MTKVKTIVLLMGVLLLGGVFGVHATSGNGPDTTYEQTAQDVYASFREAVEEMDMRLEDLSNAENFQDITAHIAKERDMSTERVREIIASHQDVYVENIRAEKKRLMDVDMLNQYETEKKKQIQEEMTEDAEDFLEEITE